MRNALIGTALGGLLVIVALFAANVSATDAPRGVLKEYKSLYRNVSVVQHGNRRCVRLQNKKNPQNSQSCMLLDRPQTLLFFYSQAMLATLTTQKDGLEVLNVGLGGGTMPKAIRSYFPNSTVTSVELDPKMVTAAKEFMFFTEDTYNKVVVQDARYFIRKEQKRKAQYDVVLLDAFDGEYIPEHLTTQEFLEEVKAILKPDGMLLANTFSHKDFFHSESATYESVFPGFCSYRYAGSRTLVAIKGRACAKEQVLSAINQDMDKLKNYIPRPGYLLRLLDNKKDWNAQAQVFTDQFAPANLLNQ